MSYKLTNAKIAIHRVSTFTTTFKTANSVGTDVITWETAVTLINVCIKINIPL